MNAALYRDYDALAYRPTSLGEQRGAINHIKKAKARQKGLEVTFNPQAHKEFVTGFRKRKQARRKEATKQLERRAKQERVTERAERRKEMKQQLHLPEDYGIQDSDDEQRPARAAASGDGGGAAAAAAAHKADVKQYQQGAFTTTVSVTAFNARYSDEEPDPPSGAEESDGDADADAGAAVPRSNAQQQQQQQQQQQRPKKPHAARNMLQKLKTKGKGGKASKTPSGGSSKKGSKRHRK